MLIIFVRIYWLPLVKFFYRGYEKWGNEKVLIGLEWLPVVKGWALQSQKSQSLCGF